MYRRCDRRKGRRLAGKCLSPNDFLHLTQPQAGDASVLGIKYCGTSAAWLRSPAWQNPAGSGGASLNGLGVIRSGSPRPVVVKVYLTRQSTIVVRLTQAN